MPFAAAHPERVSSLILVDCFARFLEAPDFPIGAPIAELAPAPRASGGRHRPRGDDRPVRAVGRERRAPRRAWARYERSAATPGSTKAIVRLIYESDVRDVLPAIRVPTLVIHRRDAVGVPRRARPLPRRAHPRRPVRRAARHRQPHLGRRPGRDRRRDPGVRDRRSAGARSSPRARDRAVHRHRRVDAAGGRAGRRPLAGLLADHNRVVRRQLERFGGPEVKVVGDGFLATFDGPARAVRCADRDPRRGPGAGARDPCRAPRRRDRGPGRRHRRPRRPHRCAGLGARPGPARSSSRAR